MRTANGLATRRTKQPRYSESYHHGDQADTGCPDTFAVTPFHAMWAGVAPIPVWSANPNRFTPTSSIKHLGRWWIASGRFSSRGYAEGGWGALGLNV